MSEATANKLVKIYLKIREKRAELSKQDSELEEQQEIIEAELLSICKETGADGLRTEFGTVSRSVKKRFWTSDWSSFYDFVKEHNALELLEKRVAQSNMATFIEENPDLVPPGLQVDSRYTAVIRRK
jgi:hypothetical protein